MIPNLMDPSGDGEQQYKSYIEQAVSSNFCFLCGSLVLSPAKKCSFQSEQKVLLSGTSLLGLLSAVLGDRVTTDKAVVELCLLCTQHVSETDVAFLQFDKLRIKMAQLFRNNKQPKLTYQMLSQNNLNGLLSKTNEKSALQVALEDLAKTRPGRRRGMQNRSVTKVSSTNSVTDSEKAIGDEKFEDIDRNKPQSILSTKQYPQALSLPGDKTRSGAKKNGRPRKPFRCTYCRLRFISEACLSSHVSKNHSHLILSTPEKKNVYESSQVLNLDSNPVSDPQLWMLQKPNELNICAETFHEDPTSDFSNLSTHVRELPLLQSTIECPVSLPFLPFSSSCSVTSISTTPSKLETSKLGCNISGSLDTPLKLDLCELPSCSPPSPPVVISFHSLNAPAVATPSSPPCSGPSSPSLFSSSAMDDLYTIPSPSTKVFFSSELEDLYKDPPSACSKMINLNDTSCDSPSIVVASEAAQFSCEEESSYECILTSTANAGSLEASEQRSVDALERVSQFMEPTSEYLTLDLTQHNPCPADELAVSCSSTSMATAPSSTSSSMRRIQPRPHTIKRTEPDGSVVFILGSISGTLAPSVIKVSPEYIQGLPKTNICELCGASFSNQKSLVMHKNSAHGKNKRAAKLNEKTKSLTITNVGGQQLECFQCGEMCPSEGSLEQHQLNCQGLSMQRLPSLYTCNHCGKSFNLKPDYDDHLKVHESTEQQSTEKTYKCGVCGLQTSSKVALRVHVSTVHRSRPKRVSKLACSECSFKASSARALLQHMQKHTPEQTKPTTEDSLKAKSQELSSKDRMTMKLSTNSTGLLNTSTRDHSKRRCFLCGICKRIFPSSDLLRQHHKSHHPGDARAKGPTLITTPASGDSSSNSNPRSSSAAEDTAKKEGSSLDKGQSASTNDSRSFFSFVKTIDGVQWLGHNSSPTTSRTTSTTTNTNTSVSLTRSKTITSSSVSTSNSPCLDTQSEQLCKTPQLPLLLTVSSTSSSSTSPMLTLEDQELPSNSRIYGITGTDPSYKLSSSQCLWSTGDTRSDVPVKLSPCVTQPSTNDNSGSNPFLLRSSFRSCSPLHRGFQNGIFKFPSSELESPQLYCLEDDASHHLHNTDVGSDDS